MGFFYFKLTLALIGNIIYLLKFGDIYEKRNNK